MRISPYRVRPSNQASNQGIALNRPYMADVFARTSRTFPRCATLYGALLAAAEVLADTVFPVHQAMRRPIIRFSTVRYRVSGNTCAVHSGYLVALMRGGKNDEQHYHYGQERDKYHPAAYVQAVHGQPSGWLHA